MPATLTISPGPRAVPARSPAVQLSRRETQVLRLLADAHSTKQIADHLGISYMTVKHYRARLGIKLDAHCIVELLNRARVCRLL